MAAALGAEADDLAVRLVAALAAVGAAVGRDLAEADWWRLLDALTLVAAHPAERGSGGRAQPQRGQTGGHGRRGAIGAADTNSPTQATRNKMMNPP